MKYFAILMLMASYSLAELPSINDDNSAIDGRDATTDLILMLLQNMNEDISELKSDFNNLQATTDSLQTTVDDLSLKVQNMEDDFADLKNTVETGTGSMDPAIQQQITDLSSNVTALSEENEEIQQQVVDLSIKEQNDYDELDADITSLNSTVQANYQELRGDVDNIAAKFCGPLSNGYNYERVDTRYTWPDARTNCQNKGGDLAYHGLDTLDGREQLLCGYFNLCDNGNGDDGYPWIGLSRDTTTGMFKYLNREDSPFDDQLWYSLDEYDQSSQECGALTSIEYNYSHFLQAFSDWCDSLQHTSICEFRC